MASSSPRCGRWKARASPVDLNDFPPMLLEERPLGFDVPGWVYEIKYDGYRLTAMFGDGQRRLRSWHFKIRIKVGC